VERRGRRRLKGSLPPGPRDGGVGFLRAATSGGLLRYFAATSRRYGPISSFRRGTQRLVFVDDAKAIEEILVSRQHEFVRDRGATLLRELVGTGLLTTDDPAHLVRRRIMQPAFHRGRVAQYAATIVTETDRVVERWTGAPLDVGSEMACVTVAAVGSTLFGTDLRDEAARIAAILARVLERGTSLAAFLAFAAPLLDPLHRLFPTRSSLLFPRERAELDAIVAPIVRDRRDASGDDLLSLLLAARDDAGSTLGESAVRNEVVMLILAGHETTANALTWTWYLLAEHPAVAARVRAELDAVLGGRAPGFDDVPKLRYTAAVFDEALRLYPPAGAFARRPLREIRLGAFRIPKMASVFVSPFVTQRNGRYFPEPLAFRPERWYDPPSERFAYFPFGGGSKTCIGESFARMEAILVLARIASRFSLERADASPVEIASAALVRPARPITMRAIRR
jgi:cytochrome P450